MMRVIATALLLGACARVAGPERPPEQPMPKAACRTDAAAALVGRPFTAALSADAQQRVGATTVRVIRPGMAVTMDYRPDRLNIELDERDMVIRFGCS